MYGRAVLVIATVTLVGCTPLVTSSQDYRTAGARTAGDASSQVACAARAAQLAIDDRAYQRYLGVVVSDAEGALDGIESTFGDLQPPNAEDEAMRSDVLAVVGDAADEVASVRVAIMAGRAPSAQQVERLDELQMALQELAGELA